MKKNYVSLWVSVTAFDKDDVVTASVEYNTFKDGVGVDAKETWWQ